MRITKPALIGLVTACVAAGVLIALAFGWARESGSPDTVAGGQLETAARGMYTDILKGNYASAYDYRSDRCKKAMTREGYEHGLQELFKKQTWDNPIVNLTVTSRAPGMAMVQAQAPGVESEAFDGYSRRWLFVNQSWKYDGC